MRAVRAPLLSTPPLLHRVSPLAPPGTGPLRSQPRGRLLPLAPPPKCPLYLASDSSPCYFVFKRCLLPQAFPARPTSPPEVSLSFGRPGIPPRVPNTSCPQDRSAIRGRQGWQGASDPPRTMSCKLFWAWFLGGASGSPLRERGRKGQARLAGPWVPCAT